jgi:hypothetical protein
MSDTEMPSGLHRPLQQKSINVKSINEKMSRRNGILRAILHGKISTITTRDAPYAQAVFFLPPSSKKYLLPSYTKYNGTKSNDADIPWNEKLGDLDLENDKRFTKL